MSFYGPAGEPITLTEWADLFEVGPARIVAHDLPRPEVLVSTVWLGINTSIFDPPMIYETMVFGGPLDQEQWRYPTREAAEQGHRDTVALVRAIPLWKHLWWIVKESFWEEAQ